jgi:PAS domain-containing protein
MVIVSLDSSLATPEMGELGVVYSEVLATTAIILGILFVIIYRVTLKPFEVLNEDIDKALKGEINQVTHEYKFEELNSLWEIINSAIQRASKSGAADSVSGGLNDSSDGFTAPLRLIGGLAKFGLIVFDADKKIVFINPTFEEMSGIRSDNAMGQDISVVARDQAMGAMTNDMMGRVMVGTEGVSEDFDFSGVPCKIHMAGFGTSGNPPKCFMMAAVRVE